MPAPQQKEFWETHFTIFSLWCILNDNSSKTSNCSLGQGSCCALGYDYSFHKISCYLHLYVISLLKLLKQFQLCNTYVNWIGRNTLHFEGEAKDRNCQQLSTAEQSIVGAQIVFPTLTSMEASERRLLQKEFWSSGSDVLGKVSVDGFRASVNSFNVKNVALLGWGFASIYYILTGLGTIAWCCTPQTSGTSESIGMFFKNSWPHSQKLQVSKFVVGPWNLNFNTKWFWFCWIKRHT